MDEIAHIIAEFAALEESPEKYILLGQIKSMVEEAKRQQKKTARAAE